jgi:capsid protein
MMIKKIVQLFRAAVGTPPPPAVQNNLRAGNPQEGYRRRNPQTGSFDALYQRSNPRHLVANCREQAADNPLVTTIRRRKKNHVIRTGIQPLFSFAALGTNQRFAKRWRRWAKRCDARQRLPLDRLQRLMIDDWFASGAFFIKKVLDFSNKNISPLRIQLLDRDHLDTTKNGVDEEGITRRGIKYTQYDKVLGYWIFDRLPSDNYLGALSQESRYIPAAWLLYVYDPERISQKEGLPELSSSAPMAGDLDDFRGTSILQALAGATDGGTLVGGDTEDIHGLAAPDPGRGIYSTPSSNSTWPVRWDDKGNLQGEDTVISLGGPVIRVLPKGEFRPPNPRTPNADLPNFASHCSLGIAGPSGLSYEMATGDISKSSFAGIMASQQFSAVDFECQQYIFIDETLDRIMEWWMETEWLFGPPETKAALAGYGDDPDEYLDAVTWQYNGEQTLNPYQHVKSAKERIDLGLGSHRGEAASIGENFDENISQQLEEYDLLIEREEKRLRLLELKKRIQDAAK